ncbi:MAG TPA: hypothetical protein VHN77_11280 [Phycisphaerales bacterium]|nr:hypothetical protein [Phycisphaerales bacterium]
MNQLLSATVGAAALVLTSITTSTLVTAQTDDNVIGADAWDDIEGVLNDICEVCGCAWARSPQASGIAASAEAVIESYQANGVLPEATPAQRADARTAVAIVQQWIRSHPGALAPDLEARLLETIERVDLEL